MTHLANVLPLRTSPSAAGTPAPAPATGAGTFQQARDTIAAILTDHIGADAARRLMILADMDPAAAVAPMLANALLAAEATLARVFPDGVA